jgi:hypothetical protein
MQALEVVEMSPLKKGEKRLNLRHVIEVESGLWQVPVGTQESRIEEFSLNWL